MSEFILPYHIFNNGDGSASVHPHKTMEEAEQADSEEEGWGEDLSGCVTLKTERDKIYYQEMKYNQSEKKFDYIWIPLPTKP